MGFFLNESYTCLVRFGDASHVLLRAKIVDARKMKIVDDLGMKVFDDYGMMIMKSRPWRSRGVEGRRS